MNERMTCPECNFQVINQKCTNPDNCGYRGLGWTMQQRSDAWSRHGEWERTVGTYYNYTGRDD